MYILLNNYPVNIYDIVSISTIIEIDSKLLLDARIKHKIRYVDILEPKEIPEAVLKMTEEELRNNADSENTIWGYFFYVEMKNHINDLASKAKSKNYQTEEEAQKALDSLLTEINTLRDNLPKVWI